MVQRVKLNAGHDAWQILTPGNMATLGPGAALEMKHRHALEN